MGSRLFTMRRNFHRADYAVANREELVVEVEKNFGKEVGEY
jgi:hypothetical protein